jgi:site-specific DNA-methyltransferase (adenine-specific)
MSKAKVRAKVTPPEPEFVVGDCRRFMPERWPAGSPPSAKPKLVIVDSPYNYGEPYDVHDDDMEGEEFVDWCRGWLADVNGHALHPDGSVWLFWPDELVSFMDVYCQRELGWYRRSWVVWYYTFGVCNSGGKNFSRSHTHLLYYTKKKTKFTFHPEAVRVPSARQMVYNDRRAAAHGKMPDNTWMLLKSQMDEVFSPDQDTWLQSRVCGTYDEREEDSPNQIPLPIMERIVLSTSDPGDLVFDPMCGSGTANLAAHVHGRPSVGVDVSAKYVANARERVRAHFAGLPVGR